MMLEKTKGGSRLPPKAEVLEPIDARLVNPFLGDDLDDMRGKITRFLSLCNIESIYHPLIVKGAWLAQDEAAFSRERADGLLLDDSEKDALKNEAENKWTQPLLLYALVACCSMGAMVQGWDEVSPNSFLLRDPVKLTTCCRRPP